MKPTLKTTFGKNHNILIGVIHLPPLLSLEGSPGMKTLIQKALHDLKALESAGFDGALLENEHDKPHTEFANPAQIASFTAIASEVQKKARIPIGIQMMLNDWRSSFAIAAAVGANFTRLDVFVDDVTCDWGPIHPDPEAIMKEKQSIAPNTLLMTDIQVKYKTLVTPRPLTTSAKLAIDHGSDVLVITGDATGKETPKNSLEDVREMFPEVPMFVGAGIHQENIEEQLNIANGCIVGTSIKQGDLIHSEKALSLKLALERGTKAL